MSTDIPANRRFVIWITSRRAALVALMLVLISHGIYAFVRGPGFTTESETYRIWAGELIQHGTAVPSTFSRPAFTILVAAAMLVSGAAWPWAVIVLNVLAHGIMAALLLDIVMRGTKSADSATIAVALVLLSHDFAAWLNFIVPDSTFVAVSFGTFVLAARAVMARSMRVLGGATAALLICLMYGAGAVVLLPMYATAAFLVLSPSFRVSLRRLRPKHLLAGTAAVVLLTIVIVPLVARSSVDIDTVARAGESLDRGVVVWDWPETDHVGGDGYLRDVAVAADRILRFFLFWSERFSLTHNLMNAVFFMPLYGLLAAGATIAVYRSRSSPLIVLSSITIVAFALGAAFSPVDSQWRYRLPALPHMILLGSIAARQILIGLGIVAADWQAVDDRRD